MVRVREIRQGDLRQLYDLFAQLHEDNELPASVAFDYDALSVLWDGIMESPNHHVLVGEVDGEIVATCALVIIPNFVEGMRPYAVIENLAVAKAHRRQGYAEACLRYAIEFAREKNCYKVLLLTKYTNELAENLYRRVGFGDDSNHSFVMHLSD